MLNQLVSWCKINYFSRVHCWFITVTGNSIFNYQRDFVNINTHKNAPNPIPFLQYFHLSQCYNFTHRKKSDSCLVFNFSQVETLRAKQALCRPDLWPHPNWPPTPQPKWMATTMMVISHKNTNLSQICNAKLILLQAMSGGREDTWAVWTDHLHPRCLPQAHKSETFCTWQVRKSPWIKHVFLMSVPCLQIITFNALL